MKQKITLFAAALFFVAQALHAQQQRKCEMQVSLLSPAAGSVIQAYAQYTLTVRIQNNGPDDLLLGDTLWYNIPTMPLISYATYILPAPINSGDSKDITLAALVNDNQNTQDETINFYITLRSSVDTAHSAYRDMDLSNNTDARQVTFKPCDPDGNGGTSVNNVSAKALNIVVYPNPSSREISISSGGLDIRNAVIADLSGRIVYSASLTPQPEYKIDIAALPAGMYFLKMETAKGIATAKIIKN